MKHMKLPTQYVQEASAQFDLLMTLMARVDIYSGSTNVLLKALVEHAKRESDLDHEEQFLGAVIEYLDASERYYSPTPICEWCAQPTHQGKGWCCDDAARSSQPTQETT
jgi:hypothetical protein